MRKDKHDGMSLVDVLASGDMDLLDVLVRSGISCRSCIHNPKRQESILCEHSDQSNCVLVSCTALSCCMHWRENRTDDEIRLGPKLYKKEA